MGYLVLSRRRGESINIVQPGKETVTFRVNSIHLDAVWLHFDDGVTRRLGFDSPLELGNGCSVHLSNVTESQCKLAFRAPTEIKIIRSELGASV